MTSFGSQMGMNACVWHRFWLLYPSDSVPAGGGGGGGDGVGEGRELKFKKNLQQYRQKHKLYMRRKKQYFMGFTNPILIDMLLLPIAHSTTTQLQTL